MKERKWFDGECCKCLQKKRVTRVRDEPPVQVWLCLHCFQSLQGMTIPDSHICMKCGRAFSSPEDVKLHRMSTHTHADPTHWDEQTRTWLERR